MRVNWRVLRTDTNGTKELARHDNWAVPGDDFEVIKAKFLADMRSLYGVAEGDVDGYGNYDFVIERARPAGSLVKNAPEKPIKTAHYPTVEQAYERLQRDREDIAARSMLYLGAAGVVGGLIGYGFGWVVASFMLFGSAVTFLCTRIRRQRKYSYHD